MKNLPIILLFFVASCSPTYHAVSRQETHELQRQIDTVYVYKSHNEEVRQTAFIKATEGNPDTVVLTALQTDTIIMYRSALKTDTVKKVICDTVLVEQKDELSAQKLKSSRILCVFLSIAIIFLIFFYVRRKLKVI